MTTTKTNLKWHKSEIEGWATSTGDVMFWSDGFPEAVNPWISFRAARENTSPRYVWTLRIWTGVHSRPVESYFGTLAECKAAADMIAEAVTNRYSHGERLLSKHAWMVTPFVEEVERAVSLWVQFPEQRDSDDLARLAKVGIERVL